MNEIRYMISDAARKVDVEAHVLRYWEEELDMPVARNEMGHRYYTNEDIQVFQNIKELKRQGFQLKAIKLLLPDLKNTDVKSLDGIYGLKEELNSKVGGEDVAKRQDKQEAAEVTATTLAEEPVTAVAETDKMAQFQAIIGNVVKQVLEENNKSLGREVSEQVSGSVVKEMDYVMRLKEEREEERYKKLDETIRNFQHARQEVAFTDQGVTRKKRRGLFRKKEQIEYEEL